MRPSAVLSAPAYLSDDQRKRYYESLQPRFMGALNAGNVPLLEGGWTYTQTSLNSVDAEFLASRQFSVSDICRLFNVPEVLLQIGTRSITDLSSYVTSFAQLCLSPLVTTIEAEFDAILPSGMHLTLDLDGLQRGSFSAVTAAICAMTQSGILSPNNAREAAGWPRSDTPGADDLRPGNPPSWPADGQGSEHLGPSPGPRGDGPSEPGNNQNEGAG